MSKLTDKSVEALAPQAREYCVWDTEAIGFGVRIRPSGSKSFILVYRWGGNSKRS